MKNVLPATLLLTLLLSACGTAPSQQTIDTAATVGLNGKGPTLAPTGRTPRNPAPYTDMQPISPDQVWPAVDGAAANTPPVTVTSQATTRTVRVYYSDPLPSTDTYRGGGGLYAALLANLLGQYSNVQVIRTPISQYRAGDAQNSWRTFYIGSVFDEAVPGAFMADVKAGAPVTWIGYNIWKMGDALGNLGLNYKELHAAYSPSEIATTFNTINYKNYAYHKYAAGQDMVEVTADPAKTQTLATASDAAGDQIPYLVKSGKFYYVADNPFLYTTPTDRYLVLADSLKGMLGDTQAATCKKQAILRLEDVSALNNPQGLQRMLDVIQELRIPFAMTVIPEAYSGGVHYDWLSNGAELLQVYRAALLGGTISQHGYTHNYHGLLTPEGDSAVGWEFWNGEQNAPISGLTPAVAQNRVIRGELKLWSLGLVPQLWTTPHYEAAVNLYPAIGDLYPRVLEGRIYSGEGETGGQFFPYPVKDVYGAVVLPENLGYVNPDNLPADILAAADANKNLDCAYASLFVHPYLLQDGNTGPDKLDKASFKALIQGVQAKGFTFVNPAHIQLRTLP